MTSSRYRGRGLRADGGFTMVETLVALAVICVVLASLTLFYVQSTTLTRRQADTQTATQLAMAAMEEASQFSAGQLLVGRSQAAVNAQKRPPAVDAYFTSGRTELSGDDSESGGSATPALPTTPQQLEIAGVKSKFERSWYVGRCWQPRAGEAEAHGGECVVVPEAQRATRLPMYRVIVAITWPDKDCPNGSCAYVTATLVSKETQDPTFM